VVADPVFSADDERLAASNDSGEEPRAAARVLARLEPTRTTATSYDRLPYSGLEARSLMAMVGPEASYSAFDLDASKQLVLSGRLEGYEIVHFATHGQLHEQHPELSGLVLSLVDEAGRPVDGFLHEHEVFTMRLPCKLVVLSACETALGPEISGEGIAGITRAFMYAGARQIMVSLWQVADRGTAELMQHFYQGLIDEGMAPPAALRAAQIAMLGHEQDPGSSPGAAGRGARSAPYFWAGFVLQGGYWPQSRTE
jgi:CHAT domain-containing protein